MEKAKRLLSEHPLIVAGTSLLAVLGLIVAIIQIFLAHDANKFVKRDNANRNLTTQVQSLGRENDELSDEVKNLQNQISILRQEYQVEADDYVRKISESEAQKMLFHSRLTEYSQFLDALLLDEYSAPEVSGNIQLQNDDHRQLTPYLEVGLMLVDREFLVTVNEDTIPASVGEVGVFLTSRYLCELAVVNDDTTFPQPSRTQVPAIRVELDWKCWRRQ
ncbi:hypothetical protein L53_09915 [Hyphomonas sp. L-53-1-40]|uniref:hypothetical protein n=1 Tax=Hyphomonas sp. L-53-1-40 TaxID=1207058 RepID=UPI000458B4AA|nr:hypothetical protein [Hyphomonas sp. L-53-1-40]KCZ62882.1 hypothetical protein L53_09915 [Hyphomonas sp. L-53-1-40]